MNPENNTKRRYSDKEASVYRDFKHRQMYINDQLLQMRNEVKAMRASVQILAARLNIKTPSKTTEKKLQSTALHVKKETTCRHVNILSEKPSAFTNSYSNIKTVSKGDLCSSSDLPSITTKDASYVIKSKSIATQQQRFSETSIRMTSSLVNDHTETYASSEVVDASSDPEYDDIYEDITSDLVTIDNPLHKGLQKTNAVFDFSADTESIAESQSSFTCLDTFDILSSRLVLHASLQSVIAQSTIFTFDALTPISHAGGVLISVMEFLLFLFSYEWLEVLLWWIEGFV
jgi:hypothetical protein